MSVPAVAIRRPVTTTMLCIGVVLLGLVSYGGLAVDLLPDIATPRITVVTRAEGLAPTEVEQLVTQRIEQAVARVAGLQLTSSVSREAMSVVTLSFPWGVDLDLAALHVREGVDQVLPSLPPSASRPSVLRWDPGSEPVMGVAVAGAGGLGTLRELVEAVVVTRMEQVEGIAGAQVTGGAEREVQIELDPQLLTLYGITVADVAQRLPQANLSQRSGEVLQGAFAYSVQVLGEFETVDDIAGVPVGTDPQGVPIRIEDVGRVYEGTRPRLAGALLNGEPAVGVLLYREAGTNTIEAVERALAALDELRGEYPELTMEVAFENASFIQEAIDSVVQNIGLGGLIAFGVLFLFLRDPRNPVLLGVSIPVSLIATFTLCYFSGITLNIMTLGGLALGVGMLVDNSIVVLENIYRLRQGGLEPEAAARRGAEEVAMAVSAATLTTIAVFLPIAYVQGVAGELFAPQAWTVTFALLASLVVSLSVLPMLAARFLRLESFGLEEDDGGEGEAVEDADRAPEGPGARRPAAPAPPETTMARDAAADHGEGSPGGDRGPAEVASGATAADETGRRPGPWARLGERRRRLGARARRVGRAAGRPFGWLLVWIVALPLFWVRSLGRLIGFVLGPIVAAFGAAYDGFARLYHATLVMALRYKALTLMAAAGLLTFGVWLALELPRELLPPVNTGRFEARLEAPPGTPFQTLEGMVRRLDQEVRAVPGVGSTFATVGLETSTAPGAASGAMSMSPTRAFLTVVMAGERSRSRDDEVEAAMQRVRSTASEFPDATVVIDPQRSPLQQLIGTDSGGFRIAVQGSDLEQLDALATEAAARLRELPGFDDVVAHNPRGNPEIELAVRRHVAERYGVDVRRVVDALIGSLHGQLAQTQYAEFDRRLDIRITARPGEDGLESVLDRPYPTSSGPVPLRELVGQEFAEGPTEVVRTDRVREVPITATLTDLRLSDAVAAAQQALVGMSWPTGYRFRVAGEQLEVQASFRNLMWALALAALLVYMVMAAQFESLNHPFVILLSLPLGWVGVVTALALTGQSINVVALIGGVVLTGIIVNDAIIKIDTINRLRRERGMERRQAVLEGSALRLRPILMTSVTTTCALIPMALGFGAGAELQRPLAIAIIGGETTGTLLTLIIIPVIYELFDRTKSFEGYSQAAPADAG